MIKIPEEIQKQTVWEDGHRLFYPQTFHQRIIDTCYESASSEHVWQPLKFGEVCIACGKSREICKENK